MSPALPPQFLAPDGWQTGTFTHPETNHTIHYGYALPDNPSAIVVCLPGLSEFTEKYYETARDMLARGYGFFCIDWAYQGRSTHMDAYPQRRHSDGFETDLDDLSYWIDKIIRPKSASVPLLLLAHSMGGNLALRFLSDNPRTFAAAAITSPLLGIYNFTVYLKAFACIVRPFRKWIGAHYVPGGKDWHETMRKSDGTDIFSSDPVRDTVHNIWCKHDQALQVGSPTFEWVLNALGSCARLLAKGTIERIKTPTLIALAGDDKIVDNRFIHLAAARLPKGKLLELDGANHEILMERDIWRNAFLGAFDKFLEENKITPAHHLNEETDMQGYPKNKDRLSDRVLYALELAIEQEDLPIAELLNNALELAMTRNSGGGEFIERRDYPNDVEEALSALRKLKSHE